MEIVKSATLAFVLGALATGPAAAAIINENITIKNLSGAEISQRDPEGIWQGVFPDKISANDSANEIVLVAQNYTVGSVRYIDKNTGRGCIFTVTANFNGAFWTIVPYAKKYGSAEDGSQAKCRADDPVFHTDDGVSYVDLNFRYDEGD